MRVYGVLFLAVTFLALGWAEGQRAYVGNAGNGTVVVVDLKARQVVGAWSGFQQPWSVAQAGGKVYVAEYVGQPGVPRPAGRVRELDREGKTLRVLVGAHYPMGVAAGKERVYVASSAVDWSGNVAGEPEILVYGPSGMEPLSRKPFPSANHGYPQTLLFTPDGLYVATIWGVVLLLDPDTLETRLAFSLPQALNPVRGLARDPEGNLYLSGQKEGVGRVVRLPKGALLSLPEPQDASGLVQVLAEGLPEPWGLAFFKGSLLVVTTTDASGKGPGKLLRLDPRTGQIEELLVLPTRYTLGLAVEE